MLKRSCEQIFSIFRKAEWPIFSVYVYWFVLSAAIYFHFIWMHNLGDMKGKSSEGTNQISQKLPMSRKMERNSLNKYRILCTLDCAMWCVIHCVKTIPMYISLTTLGFVDAPLGRHSNVMELRNREDKTNHKRGGFWPQGVVDVFASEE